MLFITIGFERSYLSPLVGDVAFGIASKSRWSRTWFSYISKRDNFVFADGDRSLVVILVLVYSSFELDMWNLLSSCMIMSSLSHYIIRGFVFCILWQHFTVYGYARSKMTDVELRNMVSKTLTCRIDKR